MRRISFFLFVSILALAVTLPAFAAVQNVKVGGDVTVRNIYRSAFDLDNDNKSDTYNGGRFGAINGSGDQRSDDTYNFFMEQVRLRVDAELTENVSGHIELLNQRDMDGPNVGTQGSALATDGGGNAVSGRTALTTGPSTANDAFDVTLNKASIEIKEFLYSPATLEVGRQDYQMGQGFVIGKDQVGQPDLQNSITADEFTYSHGFDSSLLTLDLDPWAVDLFYAKISEDNVLGSDDEDLLAINVGRKFGKYDAEAETYFVAATNSSLVDGAGTTLSTAAQIYDVGFRGSISPIKGLRMNGEAVSQFGIEGGFGSALGVAASDFTFNGNTKQAIRAFATDLRGEYDVTQVPWPTTLGIEHVFYSGEDANEEGNSANYRPLHRGKFHSAIREFQGTFYLPAVGVSPGSTNQHQFILDLAFNPFNNPDIKFFSRFLSYWFHHVPINGVTALAGDNQGGRDKHIGEEVDFQLSWAYTEDLTFDVLYALFIPGDYFDQSGPVTAGDAAGIVQSNDAAQELMTSVTLNFG